jgi:hypothetical protein
MRTFLVWLLASVSLVAQQPAGRAAGPAPTYKNLKVLAANSDVPFIMASFNEHWACSASIVMSRGTWLPTAIRKKTRRAR